MSAAQESTRWTLLRERLRSSLWFVPSLFIAVAVLAAIGLETLDRWLGRTLSGERILLVFSGGPDAARAVLETIASSILTLTGLVFSITMLVLQLTSSQYSSRALRTFLLDNTSKVAMGVFLGTFSFALVGLRAVRSSTDAADPFVPGTLTTGAFILTLASLYMFLVYIHHIAGRIQSSSIIASIATESAEVLEHLYPDPFGEPSSADDSVPDGGSPRPQISQSRNGSERPLDVTFVSAPTGGMVMAIDEPALVRMARESGVRLEVLRGVGDFVGQGEPLVSVVGGGIDDERRIARQIRLGHQRTMEQDLGYGFRQLVDVAMRALSPSINDPSTAVQSIDRIYDLLCRLGGREFPAPVRYDDEGEVRLVLPHKTWEQYVGLAFGEILFYGAEHPQVRARLEAVRSELAKRLPPERVDAVRALYASADR